MTPIAGTRNSLATSAASIISPLATISGRTRLTTRDISSNLYALKRETTLSASRIADAEGVVTTMASSAAETARWNPSPL